MKDMRKTVHFVPQYFLQPVHRIRVDLLGAGGNGSQMLSCLARIDHALRQLGQPGLHVRVYDPDRVEAPNVGRQLFTAGDLGANKAECLVTRFNRLFGNDWEAVPGKYPRTATRNRNIIISCVDNTATREMIGDLFRKQDITMRQEEEALRRGLNPPYRENYLFYWLDLGNGQRTGQAILGSNRIPQPESDEYDTVEYLPTLTEQFDLGKVVDTDSGPSCSMAESLGKQDLFVNSVLTQTAASLLWSLLTDAAIDTRGFYMNLDTYRTAPIPVSADGSRGNSQDRTKHNVKVCLNKTR